MGFEIDDRYLLKNRQKRAEQLLTLGLSVRVVAKITCEHPNQIARWKKKCVQRDNGKTLINTRKSENNSLNVCTPSKTFLAFDANGEPDIGFSDHPVDHLEPVEAPEFPENKRNMIALAALRYLLRQEPRSTHEVAAEIGCTPGGISRKVIELSQILGFKALHQKSDQAREAYRISTANQWKKGKVIPKRTKNRKAAL